MAGYHLTEIERGKYGDFSKIKEEFQELNDAHEQSNRLMELIELSDLICAIDGYLNKHFKGAITIQDLIVQSNATKRSFSSGERKSD